MLSMAPPRGAQGGHGHPDAIAGFPTHELRMHNNLVKMLTVLVLFYAHQTISNRDYFR